MGGGVEAGEAADYQGGEVHPVREIRRRGIGGVPGFGGTGGAWVRCEGKLQRVKKLHFPVGQRGLLVHGLEEYRKRLLALKARVQRNLQEWLPGADQEPRRLGEPAAADVGVEREAGGGGEHAVEVVLGVGDGGGNGFQVQFFA